MNINIKKMRKTLGLSQLEFGERIGCAQTNVSFIEKGIRNTSEETYDKLVRAFGLEFVKRFEEPDIQPSVAKPKNVDEWLAVFKEQQRQTNEVIELLRQAMAKLVSKDNRDILP